METLDFSNATQYIDHAYKLAMGYGPKIILAFLTYIIGSWAIGKASSALSSQMQKRDLDPSLRTFSSSLISITLKILLAISVASMVGIATTSFVAILGAAGLAIGLSLQGTLSNFAGSFLILIFKPFRVGDLVEIAGSLGVVSEIQIFCTLLTTPDARTIILPNGAVANGSITNYSLNDTKRLDLTFGISYDDNIKKAKEVLMDVLKADSRVLSDPAPLVAVSELGDSSINFAVRPWVKTDDFWDVNFTLHEKVKDAFDAANISIPYPTTDINIKNK
jgi:small conductance mechanosensitive channel